MFLVDPIKGTPGKQTCTAKSAKRYQNFIRMHNCGVWNFNCHKHEIKYASLTKIMDQTIDNQLSILNYYSDGPSMKGRATLNTIYLQKYQCFAIATSITWINNFQSFSAFLRFVECVILS
jgi:hypothetical protein